jgi:hypothetical protein
MSVIPVIDVTLFPNHRVPRRNGGSAGDVDCWFFIHRNFIVSSNDMRLHFDEGDNSQRIIHGVIEPGSQMNPSIFTSALHGTAHHWTCLDH